MAISAPLVKVFIRLLRAVAQLGKRLISDSTKRILRRVAWLWSILRRQVLKTHHDADGPTRGKPNSTDREHRPTQLREKTEDPKCPLTTATTLTPNQIAPILTTPTTTDTTGTTTNTATTTTDTITEPPTTLSKRANISGPEPDTESQPGTATVDTPETIPLDDIACSLTPYPYLDRNSSLTSLHRAAARSAHASAVSSRNASRSQLYLGQNASGNVGLGRQSVPQMASERPGQSSPGVQSGHSRNSTQEGPYTFDVRSPDDPSSPASVPGARRQYSLSSPQLGNAHPGYDIGIGSANGSWYNSGKPVPSGEVGKYFDKDQIQRSYSSSPAASSTDLDLSGFDPRGGAAGAIIRTRPSASTRVSRTGAETEGGASVSLRSSSNGVEPLAAGDIQPMVPEWTRRYEREAYVGTASTNMIIPPLTLDFNEDKDPEGWKSILHPEGALYFYNESKKVVTDVRLFDHAKLALIEGYIQRIDAHLREHNIKLPENITLALDLAEDDERVEYYFADHDRRIVFFLDDLDADSQLQVWGELKNATSLYHVRHELEAQYWYHGTLYPITVEVTHERVARLRDEILMYIGDSTTSQYSTSPYSLEELRHALSYVNSIKKNIGDYPGCSNTLCRYMVVFARQKFYNWHGTPHARIHRNHSVHGKVEKTPTLLIRTLSPLLFSAPDTHLKNLENMWVDGIMHAAVWQSSIAKLNDEWQELILYATVLLNANVAWLAIQSVDIDNNPYRSPIQISSYLSIVASVGSIILGLLLMRQNRTRSHGSASDVWTFLKARSHPRLGLETLAILYSLPYALLLWGMVSFLSAFGLVCFMDSSAPTRSIMGVAWFAFAVLVAWCVWMGWAKHEQDYDAAAEEAAATEAPDVDPLIKEKDGGLNGDVEDNMTSTSRQGSTRPTLGVVGRRVLMMTRTLKLWTWPPGRLILDQDRTGSGSNGSARTHVIPNPNV